jgi:hypothetical protein
MKVLPLQGGVWSTRRRGATRNGPERGSSGNERTDRGDEADGVRAGDSEDVLARAVDGHGRERQYLPAAGYLSPAARAPRGGPPLVDGLLTTTAAGCAAARLAAVALRAKRRLSALATRRPSSSSSSS